MKLAPLALAAVVALAAPSARAADLPYGTFRWPVEGPVMRAYVEPSSPYSAGHRGIDIVAPLGTPVLAPADGTVAFAGRVAGSLYVSVDHAGGIRTTYSWLSSVAVAKGDEVRAGDVIGASGPGHAGVEPAHLHFGARLNGDYIDPLPLLEGLDVSGLIHLARLPPAA